MASGKESEQDQLAASLDDLFTNVSAMIKGELQGTNNVLELLEKMNVRVAEEYKGFGDVASGLRVFVEQLKSKSTTFDDYVQQLDAIEQHVAEFEDVISVLDKYVSLLESRMQSVYQTPSSLNKAIGRHSSSFRPSERPTFLLLFQYFTAKEEENDQWDTCPACRESKTRLFHLHNL